MLRGALAAAVTPLTNGGEGLDEDAFVPYVEFLAAGGVDGLLALGTTGEGFLLPLEQRLRAAQLFVEAANGRLQVAVHCGAQSTWDTVELAAHAGDVGADGVAVMAPPYFPLDEQALLAHLSAAARACDGNALLRLRVRGAQRLSRPALCRQQLREAAPNFRGLKVSDTPWERFEPYCSKASTCSSGPRH